MSAVCWLDWAWPKRLPAMSVVRRMVSMALPLIPDSFRKAAAVSRYAASGTVTVRLRFWAVSVGAASSVGSSGDFRSISRTDGFWAEKIWRMASTWLRLVKLPNQNARCPMSKRAATDST